MASNWFLSMNSKMFLAEFTETSCSTERPPYKMAIFFLADIEIEWAKISNSMCWYEYFLTIKLSINFRVDNVNTCLKVL